MEETINKIKKMIDDVEFIPISEQNNELLKQYMIGREAALKDVLELLENQ